MAKVSFSKLVPLKKSNEILVDINGTEVSIKQYLPITEKAELLQWITNYIFDEYGFASPLRQTVYTDIGIIKYYTNISLTEKMLSELNKTYDQLLMNGVISSVRENIPEAELEYLENLIQTSIDQVVRYNTSALGILNSIRNDYDSTTLDAEKITAMLQDENSLKLVKDILDKIG